eukprot:scaffold895_cov315-Pinguiococcus_pyrenoidosus.AAC.69
MPLRQGLRGCPAWRAPPPNAAWPSQKLAEGDIGSHRETDGGLGRQAARALRVRLPAATRIAPAGLR